MPPDHPRVTVRDGFALVAEMGLLVAFALAGAGLASGVTGALLTVGLPSLVGALWGRWLAPKAPLRLQPPRRMQAKLALVAVAAGLLANSGSVGEGFGFLVVLSACFAVAER